MMQFNALNSDENVRIISRFTAKLLLARRTHVLNTRWEIKVGKRTTNVHRILECFHFIVFKNNFIEMRFILFQIIFI